MDSDNGCARPGCTREQSRTWPPFCTGNCAALFAGSLAETSGRSRVDEFENLMNVVFHFRRPKFRRQQDDAREALARRKLADA